MDNTWILVVTIALMLISPALYARESAKPIVNVFYKQKAPSLSTLEKVNEVLDGFRDVYDIRYYNIEDEANLELIESLGLPSTHFPFAVVIDGRFSIQTEHGVASFVHFPDFMGGIGRHEGNWTVTDLESALKDNSLLLEANILPELEQESEGQCE